MHRAAVRPQELGAERMYFYISDGDALEEVSLYGTGAEAAQRNFKVRDKSVSVIIELRSP